MFQERLKTRENEFSQIFWVSHNNLLRLPMLIVYSECGATTNNRLFIVTLGHQSLGHLASFTFPTNKQILPLKMRAEVCCQLPSCAGASDACQQADFWSVYLQGGDEWRCTQVNCMIFCATLSLMKWQSTSTCLVRSWCTEFAAMEIAAWLSHFMDTGWREDNPSSLSNWESQTTSHVVSAICLCRGPCHHLLFLCFPWQEGVS